MNAEKWLEVKRIFNEAIELSGEEREKFLSEAIQGDAEILSEVEKLIAADAESHTLSNVFSNLEAENSLIDKTIGNYKIIREIGRGGMGAVFLATREDFEKQVAVKIIKHEFSSTELKRRFQNERKILAALAHPNIAHLLDGGATEEGLPYFVMEYVEGEDLLTYCETNNLSVAERLKIFRKVCAAVSYAHSKLIVHRDLKPSNILVGRDGEPKLLDFGISKLLDDNPLEQPGTATVLGMMTPNYASPEQIRGESVSTATDTYSLGVILYELLTNALPYNITNRRIDEVARIICETEPERPSSAVSSPQIISRNVTDGNEGQRTKDKGQRTTSASLRGDLDNIILKALRKEPERRYTSVEKFSDDLRRHLEGLPVTARPDTFSYRAEKFIKRNRIAVASAALVFLFLVIGVAGISWQYVRAERERKLAEKRFSEVRQLANNVLFKYYDEADKLTGSTKMREMMVTDAISYLDGLTQDSAGNDALRKELGLAYLRVGKVQGRIFNSNLGNTSGAAESYRKGIDLLESFALTTDDPKFQWDFVNANSELSSVLRRQGKFAESDELLKYTISLGNRFLAAKPDDPTLLVRSGYSYYYLGDTLPLGQGENENITAYRRSITAAESALALAPDQPRALNIRAAAIQRIGNNLLMIAKTTEEMGDLQKAGQLRDEAETYYIKSLEYSEQMLKMFPNEELYKGMVSAARYNQSEYLFEKGDYEKVLQIQLQGVREFEQRLKVDPDNNENRLNITYVYIGLAATYIRLKEFKKAEETYAQLIKTFEELNSTDPDNFDYRQKRLQATYTYADELLQLGEIEKARNIYSTEYASFEPHIQKRDERYALATRGMMLEKIGNCALKTSQDANLSFEKKREALNNASASYQETVGLWQANGTLNSTGIEEPMRLDLVKQKVIHNQELLAKL